MKIRVAVPISGRADRGLSEPIIKRLERNPCFEVIPWETEDQHKGKYVDCILVGQERIRHRRPDLVLIVGDRIEMVGYAMAAFHANIPIAHVYAGIVGDAGTFDTVNRHVITLWSKYQFCESLAATTYATRLKLGAGQTANVCTVGCTHVDDLRIDESMVPLDDSGKLRKYMLVAYNPLTTIDARALIKDDIKHILNHCFSCFDTEQIIWVGPNSDSNHEYVREVVTGSAEEHNKSCSSGIVFHNNDLDRAKFIGLMKNCAKFIGNSSCMYYEAPYLLHASQIIPIGIRNKNRSRVTEYGASDLIVEQLEKILCKE